MRRGRTTPIVRIFDAAKAREFYLDCLGLVVVFEHRLGPGLPLQMGVKRDDCTLYLSQHHGHASPGAAMRIEVGEVDALCTALSARAHKFARPGVGALPWGTRDMILADPLGNRLAFTSAISV